ncbi:MAG: PA0069 family radical SAM protein [Phycisphaerales bacterium]
MEPAGSSPTNPGGVRGARGRGAGLNPLSRFDRVSLSIEGEALDAIAEESPDGVRLATELIEDDTRTVLNHYDTPDMGEGWTVNPYRGCEHGCIYCYARPGHEYLGLSCGIDFETKIHVKREAPRLLRKALLRPDWCGAPIIMSGVTDPYQPIERELRITRGCLEVMLELGQPVSIITKNKLILRDLDLLAAMASRRKAQANISVTSLDNELAHKMEPRASSPRDRLETIRRLSEAGVPTRVMVAPVIPAINDREVPAILEAAADAGAIGAGTVLLRLPYQLKELFLEWLERHFPNRAAHVESLIRQSRGGKLYDARPGVRGRGEGPFADQLRQNFHVFVRRYGLDREFPGLAPMKPSDAPGGQFSLFDR